VAPARSVYGIDSAQHQAARGMFPPVPFLRDLHAGVVYDWRSGRPVLAAAAPTPAEQFAALLAGYPPGADAAVAAVLARFDADDDERRVADWLEHLYADRDGHVFAGITLYEAWASGRTVEVPDVDAIAFARQVVRTQSFVSPIPDGRRRDRLYRQVQ